jgi:hypothetical protein
MAAPSLQDGIDQAGSPVRLLWKPGSPPWTPELIEPEYAGWRQEQAAWHEGVSIADLSHHMSDTFIEGPDATRLLAAVSANNYENFAVGQAKQFVPVAADGNIVTDGILLRTGEREYILSGVSAAQEWVKYHASADGYDVTCVTDPQSLFRGGADPRLFRYQVQGPLAADLVARVFGGPLPPVKFFHSVPVTLAGRRFRALRHNMAGQDGYEFIGDWQDGAAVKEALLTAGEPLGLVHVGALAYPTSGVESGWIAAPVPAIYTSPDLAGYRKYLGLYSFEGQNPLYGSFFSDTSRTITSRRTSWATAGRSPSATTSSAATPCSRPRTQSGAPRSRWSSTPPTRPWPSLPARNSRSATAATAWSPAVSWPGRPITRPRSLPPTLSCPWRSSTASTRRLAPR